MQMPARSWIPTWCLGSADKIGRPMRTRSDEMLRSRETLRTWGMGEVFHLMWGAYVNFERVICNS